MRLQVQSDRLTGPRPALKSEPKRSQASVCAFSLFASVAPGATLHPVRNVAPAFESARQRLFGFFPLCCYNWVQLLDSPQIYTHIYAPVVVKTAVVS